MRKRLVVALIAAAPTLLLVGCKKEGMNRLTGTSSPSSEDSASVQTQFFKPASSKFTTVTLDN